MLMGQQVQSLEEQVAAQQVELSINSSFVLQIYLTRPTALRTIRILILYDFEISWSWQDWYSLCHRDSPFWTTYAIFSLDS